MRFGNYEDGHAGGLLRSGYAVWVPADVNAERQDSRILTVITYIKAE